MLVSKITIKRRNHDAFSMDFAIAGIPVEFNKVLPLALKQMEWDEMTDYFIVYSGNDVIYAYNGVPDKTPVKEYRQANLNITEISVYGYEFVGQKFRRAPVTPRMFPCEFWENINEYWKSICHGILTLDTAIAYNGENVEAVYVKNIRSV